MRTQKCPTDYYRYLLPDARESNMSLMTKYLTDKKSIYNKHQMMTGTHHQMFMNHALEGKRHLARLWKTVTP